jgi:hypothetical protein
VAVPARCLPGGGCRATAKSYNKKGTAVTNNYQTGVLDSGAAARLALPETVSVAVEETAADMREGYSHSRSVRGYR